MRQWRSLGYLVLCLLACPLFWGCCAYPHPSGANYQEPSGAAGYLEGPYADEFGPTASSGGGCGCGASHGPSDSYGVSDGYGPTAHCSQPGCASECGIGCASGGCGLNYGDPFAGLDLPAEPRGPIGRFHAVPTCNVFQASAIEEQMIPNAVNLRIEPKSAPANEPLSQRESAPRLMPTPSAAPKLAKAEPLSEKLSEVRSVSTRSVLVAKRDIPEELALQTNKRTNRNQSRQKPSTELVLHQTSKTSQADETRRQGELTDEDELMDKTEVSKVKKSRFQWKATRPR